MTIMSPLHKQGYLDEANVLGVAAEALPAAHESILPDQSMGVSTDLAAKYKCIQSYHSIHCTINTVGTARLSVKNHSFLHNLEQNTSLGKTVASLCCIALANHISHNPSYQPNISPLQQVTAQINK